MQPDQATSTEAVRFLKALREETGAAHQMLESHPYSRSIAGPHIEPADYVRYLQLMQRVVAGTEAALHPLLGELVPDLGSREKGAWLRADLQALEAGPNPYPEFSPDLPDRSPETALGAFYVLEGSTLGGRVILKGLPPLPANAIRYFEGYGAETGPMWKSFLRILGSQADTGGDTATIIKGAAAGFRGIISYFNYCQANEAKGHRQS